MAKRKRRVACYSRKRLKCYRRKKPYHGTVCNLLKGKRKRSKRGKSRRSGSFKILKKSARKTLRSQKFGRMAESAYRSLVG